MAVYTTALAIALLTFVSDTNAYFLSLHALEWQNASNYCQEYCESTLASVHSQADHLIILDHIDRTPSVYTRVWLGLNDIFTSDTWQWSDASLFDFGNIQDLTTGRVVRGTYPWRSDEPDYNDSDQCVAIEVGSLYPGHTSRTWVDRKQTANYHFVCNECASKLHKYAVVNGARNFSDAEAICQQRFGTSLASIHSATDMAEATKSCKEITSSNGCWLGLNDRSQHRVYEWTDGTQWDYGTIFNVDPWYISEPGSTSDQQCIFLDPSNGADPGEYLWDDYWCSSVKPRALCNAPSEICYAGQFFIPKGAPTDWLWTTQPCGVLKEDIIPESVALLGNKQYLNTAGVLTVDMMYSIPSIGEHGNAGIAFYLDEDRCDHYYYVGIWAGHSLVFLGKQTGSRGSADWNLLSFASINPTYSLGSLYSLRVTLTDGIHWNVYLNDESLLSATDDHFNNANNLLSGYIAIRSTYSSVNVKSLYISGEARYFDSNSWYLSCTNAPTSAPTQPSYSPTSNPTLEPTTPIPSTSPTLQPSLSPTNPTHAPITASPTLPPTTAEPSVSPTYNPTVEPTINPTFQPTVSPTSEPSAAPTLDTLWPTSDPTVSPSEVPTFYPSFNPTIEPTLKPTYNPTIEPTTNYPTQYTVEPTNLPSDHPSNAPTNNPTNNPSNVAVSSSTQDEEGRNERENEREEEVARERTLPPAVIEDQIADLETQKESSSLIWIVGVPIALVATCFFGVFLLHRFWNESKEEGMNEKEQNGTLETHKRRKKSSHIRSPSASHSGSMGDNIITPRGGIDEDNDDVLGLEPGSGAASGPLLTPRIKKDTLGIDINENSEEFVIIPGTPNGIDDENGALMDPQRTDARDISHTGEISEASDVSRNNRRSQDIMLVSVPKKHGKNDDYKEVDDEDEDDDEDEVKVENENDEGGNEVDNDDDSDAAQAKHSCSSSDSKQLLRRNYRLQSVYKSNI